MIERAPFRSRSAALALYQQGRADDARAEARAMRDRDPNAADAWLCELLLALRNNDAASLGESLRKCIALRSGEWVLERIRADFARAGAPSMTSELAFKLGGALRSALGPLAPRLPPDRRRANHYYVNVVGSSYVRAFGGVDLFFPLFIGMGPTMLLLTEEAAAVTYRKFQSNIERIDRSKDTILVLGGDPYYHLTNLKKTRTTDTPKITEQDLDMMQLAAERHRPLLETSRKQISGRLMFLAATPTHSHSLNHLSVRLNELLKPICAEYDVELLNWWNFLIDRNTQKLKAEYCANAYPGDIHFSLETAGLFAGLLRGQGLIPADAPPTEEFEWTHVFEASVDSSERTRIWSEPGVSPANAFQSHKIAASHLGGRAADMLAALALLQPHGTVAMVNVRDGHLAVALPAPLTDGCLALTDSGPNEQLGQVVLDFFGRSDVELSGFSAETVMELASSRPGLLVLAIHPASLEADEERCNAVLDAVKAPGYTIILTSRPDRLSRLRLGTRKIIEQLAISNSHLPAEWAAYSIIVAR